MLRLATLYLAALLLLWAAANVASGEEPPSAPAANTDVIAVDDRLAGHATMTIVVTDDAIEAPAEMPAGLTVVTQVNRADGDAPVVLLRVPDEVSDGQVDALSGSSVVPDWLSAATRVGTPGHSAAGVGAVALVDLQPGRYLVMDPTNRREPARLVATETGLAPAMGEIRVDVGVAMAKTAIEMPAAVPSGVSLWDVTSTGTGPRELAVVPVPAGATAEQVLLALQPGREGTPLLGGLGGSWAGWSPEPVAGVGAMSPGGRVVAQVDLAPGTYAAVCLTPTGDPTPRLQLGMTHVFTVVETAG